MLVRQLSRASNSKRQIMPNDTTQRTAKFSESLGDSSTVSCDQSACLTTQPVRMVDSFQLPIIMIIIKMIEITKSNF